MRVSSLRLAILATCLPLLASCAQERKEFNFSEFLRDGLQNQHRIVKVRGSDTKTAFWTKGVSIPDSRSEETEVAANDAPKKEKQEKIEPKLTPLSIDTVAEAKVPEKNVTQQIATPVLPVQAAAPVSGGDTMSAKAVLEATIQAAPAGRTVMQQATRGKVGEMVAVKDEGATRYVKVMDDYEAASGDECRRYAVFEQLDKPGRIKTACRGAGKEKWMALRSVLDETISPLVVSPGVSAAQIWPDATTHAN